MTVHSKILATVVGALAALVSPPAYGQADLSLTVTPPMYSDGTTPYGIPYGKPKNFKVTVENTGTATGSGAQLTEVTLPDGLELEGVTGCEPPEGAESPIPCTIPDIAAGESATVKVAIQAKLPAALPETCPDPVTYTVSATVTYDSDTLEASADADTRPFLSLKSVIEGPSTAGPGDSLHYDVTVTNQGPCPALDLYVDYIPFVEPNTGVTGLLESWSTDQDPPINDPTIDGYAEYAYGPLDVGESVSLGVDVKLGSMTKDIANTTLDQEVYAYSVDAAGMDEETDPGAPVDGEWTPMNDTIFHLRVSHKATGCNTGGGEGLLGLALLGLLGLRRRFRRA
jgi:uncharacterized protein (TIGR03382 family)